LDTRRGYEFYHPRYNETRDDCTAGYCLTKQMPKLSFAQGPTFTFGFSNNGSIFELQWTGRKSTLTAIGRDSIGGGDTVRRDLRFKVNSFGMNYAYAINLGAGFIAPGFGLDIGKNVLATRIDYESNFVGEVKYGQMFKELAVGSTFFVNILINFTPDGIVGLMIRPYYQLRWFKQDLDEVNRTLNPNTWQNDPTGLESNFNNGGIQVGLVFGKRD
jgi:hypothetical protein